MEEYVGTSVTSVQDIKNVESSLEKMLYRGYPFTFSGRVRQVYTCMLTVKG